jgi:hypothetical protein
MWFETPSGQVFKLTVSMKHATNEEVITLAQASWDFNTTIGLRPISARP